MMREASFASTRVPGSHWLVKKRCHVHQTQQKSSLPTDRGVRSSTCRICESVKIQHAKNENFTSFKAVSCDKDNLFAERGILKLHALGNSSIETVCTLFSYK